MSDISQEYFDDEDIGPDDDNMQDSDGFAAQSQEEYNDCAGEGLIETGRYNDDGQSISSSSDAGESDKVSSVIDLDLELQAIKGLPAETEFYSIHPLIVIQTSYGKLPASLPAPSRSEFPCLLTSASVRLTKVCDCRRQKTLRQRKRSARSRAHRHRRSGVGKTRKTMIWVGRGRWQAIPRSRLWALDEQFVELLCDITAQQSTTTSQRGGRADTVMIFVVILPPFNAL